MMILEQFNDTWNYTFIIVAVFAILVGTYITIRKIHKENIKEQNKKEK